MQADGVKTSGTNMLYETDGPPRSGTGAEMASVTSGLPDRTPPSTRARYPGKRIQQACEVCGQAYLIAPTVAHLYHTCSAACGTALRSRQRKGRRWSEAAYAADRSWSRFR